MKARVLTKVNMFIAFLLSMLGFNSCESPMVEYGVPIEKYGCPVDTMVHTMYGVPAPMYGVEYVQPQTDSNTTEQEDAPTE